VKKSRSIGAASGVIAWKTYGPKVPAAVGVAVKLPVLVNVIPPGIVPPEDCDQV
jgi:hypothetical protein